MPMKPVQFVHTPSSDDVTYVLYPDHVVPLHVGECNSLTRRQLHCHQQVLLHVGLRLWTFMRTSTCRKLPDENTWSLPR